ncbi:pyrimidine 5'-nucleotidase [Emcibacter nanhaiensis]|uniref:Pyrimidine 5'-nucleotidase n=1 Tax=Emcibacter nanhaiensis TaxID=1505037 RepID=A0A501PCC1_9PROT|nr:pyrimidine 5'-nucleotidase [Emcibacter nanhaiensis]TPD57838.1 pyrimidine 5'-nucleotidase [Emcibacter nanhaiensis]
MTLDLSELEHWVFDLDNTLYPAANSLFDQVDQRMGRFIAEKFDLEQEEARALQKHFFRTHGTTLRGLMSEHGVSPDKFLDFVHDVDFSGLEENPQLAGALKALPGRKVIYTNADVPYAEKVLQRIGIADFFDDIFDIRLGGYTPKPDRESFRKMIEHTGVKADKSVMVEDIARNLEPAREAGMTTVWVPTHQEWSRDGMNEAHIDYTVEDLTGWLSDLAAAFEQKE